MLEIAMSARIGAGTNIVSTSGLHSAAVVSRQHSSGTQEPREMLRIGCTLSYWRLGTGAGDAGSESFSTLSVRYIHNDFSYLRKGLLRLRSSIFSVREI